MVHRPDQYRWGSYPANGQGQPDTLITWHSVCRKLSSGEEQRRARYRELFTTHADERDIHSIRKAPSTNQVLGGSRFCEQVEQALGRKLGYRKRGRPAKGSG